MPTISLADFTDFILKTGVPRITKVSEIANRADYHPATDFWKPLRDHICDFHAGKVGALTYASTGASNKKQVRYEEAIKAYKKYLAAEKPQWFKPHKSEWSHDKLIIRVNPEVGLQLKSQAVLVKLYFKQEPLTKARVQVALGIMSAAQTDKKYEVGILDVVRSKLHRLSGKSPQMDALLKGEASTFLAIWDSLMESE